MKISQFRQVADGLKLPKTVWASLRFALTAVWLLLCCAGFANAEVVLKFEHFTPRNDSLSHSSLYAIFQDSQGFIWVGTEDGLNRFDSFTPGKKFSQFRHQSHHPYSLSHNTVYSVYALNGDLWVGTRNGLNRYDRKRDRFIRYPLLSEGMSRLSDPSVWSLSGDAADNVLWIGTLNDGLFRLHVNSGHIEQFLPDAHKNSISGESIWPIYRDSRGFLWVGTDGNGLNRLIDTETGFRFEHYLSDQNVTSLHEDKNKTLWVGTMHALYYFDVANHQFVEYKLNALSQVWALTSDADGCLWIGTDGQGLYRLNPLDNSWENYRHDASLPNSLADDRVLALYADRAGSIWVGTEKGLDRVDPGYNQFHHYTHHPNNDNSLINSDVLAILPSLDGELWVGTQAGLSRYTQNREQVTHYVEALPNPTVRALHQDVDGSIWVGTDGGYLNRFDPERDDFTTYSSLPDDTRSLIANVRSIYRDRAGTLWLGTRHGLYFFDGIKKEILPWFTQLGFTQRVPSEQSSAAKPRADQLLSIIDIYEDRQQRLWVSTLEDGVLCFAKDRTQPPLHYQHSPHQKDSLSSNDMTNVLQDQDGTIWISTADSGLNKLLETASADYPSGRFLHYREQPKELQNQGLASDFIRGVLEDDNGYLWLSSFQGISRFAPDAEPTQAFKHYDIADGLQSNIFNSAYAKSHTGELFFGGINGFNSFFPDFFKTNRYPPPVILTHLEISQQNITPNSPDSPLQYPISETDTLTLAHWQNSFNLKFVALNYIQPNKNQYAYRLLGFDSEWQTIKNRQRAFFTKVPPGNYVFQVKASNNEGVWGPVNARLRIIIAPPFWCTWWAYMAYLFALCAVVWKLFLRYREAVQARQQARLNREIEQRKQSEAALHKSEEQYRILVEGTESLVAQIDNKGDFLYVNPAAQALFAVPPQALIGTSLFDFIHAEDQQKSLQALHAWIQQKPGNINFSNRLVSRDHQTRYMLWTIQPALNEQGEVIAFNSIAKDVSELKRIEDELRLAKNQAEQANRAKSEFLANMSHEIRTPMNAILGFTDILLNAQLEARHKEFLHAIETSGKSLLKLINDILDLSKVEAGKLELEYYPAELRTLFEDMRKIFTHKLQEKQLSFSLEIPDDLPQQLLIDETRVRQILLNLIGNAIKFTEQGGISLKIWFDYLAAEKNHIQLSFSVTDTGIGIPKDQQTSIFGAFEQQQNQSHAKYGGTGLGLAISKRLVEVMGGILALQSRPGDGSTFTVMLHKVQVVHGPSETHKHKTAPVPAHTQFAPASLLIADDVPLNRKLLKFYLSAHPFTLLEAENGEQAIAQAKQHHPDLILMDMKMPILDGDAATRLLKNDPQLRHIPVIALTALAMKEDEEEIRVLCDGYLSKPVSKQTLLEMLAQFLPAPTEQSDIAQPGAAEVGAEVKNAPIPEDLLTILQNTHLPTAQAFNAYSSINDIEDFALKIKALAEEYQCQQVLDWAQELYQNTQLFNLAAMQNDLHNFARLLGCAPSSRVRDEKMSRTLHQQETSPDA